MKQAESSAEYFEDLCATVGVDKTREWTELEEHMQQEREDNISVMDQLDVTDEKGLYFESPSISDLTGVFSLDQDRYAKSVDSQGGRNEVGSHARLCSVDPIRYSHQRATVCEIPFNHIRIHFTYGLGWIWPERFVP